MRDRYEKLYAQSAAYWGTLPSPVAMLLLAHCRKGRLLELGCGQGPDALYLAGKRLDVTALDVSPKAVEDLAAHAHGLGLRITALEQDMRELPGGEFDAVFSRMALQMLPPQERRGYLAQLKVRYPAAVHAHVVPISGACFGDSFICDDDLLREEYKDWEILMYEDAWTLSRVPNKDGEPYLMREARIIARRKDS